jgi:hypothetical protein
VDAQVASDRISDGKDVAIKIRIGIAMQNFIFIVVVVVAVVLIGTTRAY